MDDSNTEWQRKEATLSDKTAEKELGLTRAEMVQAIREGQLQYRQGAMHGNPYLRPPELVHKHVLGERATESR